MTALRREKLIRRGPDAGQFIRKRALARRLGIDATTIDRWRRQGRFPPAILLSDQIVVWRLADIEAWLRGREEETRHD